MTKQELAKLNNSLVLATVRTQYHPTQGSDRSGLMFGVVDAAYGEFRRTDVKVGCEGGIRRTYNLKSVTLVEIH